MFPTKRFDAIPLLTDGGASSFFIFKMTVRMAKRRLGRLHCIHSDHGLDRKVVVGGIGPIGRVYIYIYGNMLLYMREKKK